MIFQNALFEGFFMLLHLWGMILPQKVCRSLIFDEKEIQRYPSGSPRGALKAPGTFSGTPSGDPGWALESPGGPLGPHRHSWEGDFHNLWVSGCNFLTFYHVTLHFPPKKHHFYLAPMQVKVMFFHYHHHYSSIIIINSFSMRGEA